MPSHQQVPATAPPPHNEEQAHAGARTRREGRRGRVGRRSGDICAHWGRTKFRDPDRFRNLPDAVNSPSRGSQDEVLATAPPSTPEGKGGAGAGAGAGATSGRSQTKIRAPQSCRNPDTSTVSDTVPDTESHHFGNPQDHFVPPPPPPPPPAGGGRGRGRGRARFGDHLATLGPRRARAVDLRHVPLVVPRVSGCDHPPPFPMVYTDRGVPRALRARAPSGGDPGRRPQCAGDIGGRAGVH